MRKAKRLRRCGVPARKSQIWQRQREQFAASWRHRLGGRSGVRWLRSTRACESGGNYRTNTGNGFYGAYQFDASSWRGAGGRGYAHQAPPREQDYRATVWKHIAGTGAWPVCG